MDSNEEYLDQLLRSLTEETSSKAIDGGNDPDQDDGLGDLLNQFSDDMDSVPPELLSGLMNGTENVPEGQSEEDVLSGMIQDVMEQNSEEPVETVPPEPVEETEPFVSDADEQPDSDQAEPSEPEISQPSVSDADEQAESDMAWETEFDMFKDLDADEMEQTQSGVNEPESVEPDISEQDGEDMYVAAEPEPTDPSAPDMAPLDMTPPDNADGEDDDLGSLLESLGAEGQELSNLLDKAERDEPVEDTVDSLMQDLNGELPLDADYGEETPSDEEELPVRPEKKRKKKERVKKERVKKEKVKKEKKPRGKKKPENQELQEPADDMPDIVTQEVIDNMLAMQQEMEENADTETESESVVKGKKQGFWGKLLSALTQEEEPEEEPADLVSDENGEILKELDKEKKQAKGKKKKGKDKKAAGADEDEELEEADDSKKKKKKEKKPKKEKPPVPVEDLLPGKKLSLRKVLPIILVVLAFGLAYVLVSHLYIDYVNKRSAEKAYYAGDYMECYSLLFGQDRNDNQEMMYHKAELVLQMERMKGNYRRLVMEGKELEALDYLVQCICRRESFYQQGQEWNSMDVVEETFTGMTALLTANYGLTEERAAEIAALKSDVDYTLALMEVLEALNSEAQDEQEPAVSYEDLLPEEEEHQDTTFIDTGYGDLFRQRVSEEENSDTTDVTTME